MISYVRRTISKPSGIQFRLDSIEIFGWGRELCSALLLGVRKGTTPRAGLRLGHGCVTRGEGVSEMGRSPRLGAGRATGPRRCGGKWMAVGPGLASGPQSVLLFKIPFPFPNLFMICKLI
jgi:hypothetical protein